MDTIPKPEMTPPPVPPDSDLPPKRDTQELPVLKKEMRRAFRINEIWTFVVAVGTAGGALLGGYVTFIDKAEAAGEKKAATVQAQQQSDHDAIRRLSAEFTAHVESESGRGTRIERKMNAMLDRFDVKDPAPTPKDAGR